MQMISCTSSEAQNMIENIIGHISTEYTNASKGIGNLVEP